MQICGLYFFFQKHIYVLRGTHKKQKAKSTQEKGDVRFSRVKKKKKVKEGPTPIHLRPRFVHQSLKGKKILGIFLWHQVPSSLRRKKTGRELSNMNQEQEGGKLLTRGERRKSWNIILLAISDGPRTDKRLGGNFPLASRDATRWVCGKSNPLRRSL